MGPVISVSALLWEGRLPPSGPPADVGVPPHQPQPATRGLAGGEQFPSNDHVWIWGPQGSWGATSTLMGILLLLSQIQKLQNQTRTKVVGC